MPVGTSSLTKMEVIICLGWASLPTSVQPTWHSREASSLPARRRSFLFGLAPDGGCLAADVATRAGELLPRLFTLTLDFSLP